MARLSFLAAKGLLCCSYLLLVCRVGLASESIELARGVGQEAPQQPQVAVDDAGTIHVVYGVGNTVRYRRSDDLGKTFSKEVTISFARNMSLGMRRGPRITATKQSVCISAIGGRQGKGQDGDLLAIHSSDKGNSWSEPVTINDAGDAAREGLHAMAAGPNGEICCVWLDLRNRATQVFGSVSRDGGKTWSKNSLVYKSPDKSVCECCHPSVVFDARGRIYVQWRNSIGGSRDIYLAISTDGGTSFGEAVKLGSGTWKLDHCPMDGGAIAIARDGIVSVWRREQSIFISSGRASDERRVGDGEQPWIAATDAGPFVVWITERGGTAYQLGPTQKSPTEVARHVYEPVVEALPNGKASVVVAWESREGKESVVHCRVIK